MEQQIKERLVGAGVLVILGVLLIPEFLSGPADQIVDTESSIALPAGEDQEMKSHTIRLDQKDDRDNPPVAQPVTDTAKATPDPAPQTVESAVTTAEAKVTPQNSPPASKPAETVPSNEEEQVAAARPGGWAVQVGSFSSKDNANRLAATIESMGYRSFVTQTVVSGKTHNRVRVGPMASREEAAAIAKELQEQGQQASVVTQP